MRHQSNQFNWSFVKTDQSVWKCVFWQMNGATSSAYGKIHVLVVCRRTLTWLMVILIFYLNPIEMVKMNDVQANWCRCFHRLWQDGVYWWNVSLAWTLRVMKLHWAEVGGDDKTAKKYINFTWSYNKLSSNINANKLWSLWTIWNSSLHLITKCLKLWFKMSPNCPKVVSHVSFWVAGSKWRRNPYDSLWLTEGKQETETFPRFFNLHQESIHEAPQSWRQKQKLWVMN